MATYKYLTTARINSTIKKHNLELAYTKGDGYFYFLDLKTGDKVGESVMVAKMHHLSIQQWREAAEAARAGTPVTATQEVAKAIKTDAAKIRELIESLEDPKPESKATRASRIARNVVAQGIKAAEVSPVETWDDAVEATQEELVEA